LNIKIVSGGQTGADRAALDWAIEHGVPHGGWCPQGRRAEDGTIPANYLLQETPTADPAQRTEWNVRDSDATVILSNERTLTRGSKKTEDLAHSQGKPVIHLCKRVEAGPPGQTLRQFLQDHQIRVLNVAGPRASEEPGVASFVREVMNQTFGGPAF
jgi:hypothetical protein